MKPFKKPPKKHQPKGYDLIYEDRDILVGNKEAGVLTVAAKFDRVNTVHHALNMYVRKGQVKSHKCVYVVHRLDQATTGVLLFAKTEQAQFFLKENWPNTIKTYFALVHGHLPKSKGRISSLLAEDEDYVVSSGKEGKIAHTEYEVVKTSGPFSLLKINLLTGRKNQIRVHMASEGHPVVGDTKYGDIHGDRKKKIKKLMLHAETIEFDHPYSRERMTFSAPFPDYFKKLVSQ